MHIGARVSALAGPNDVLVSSTLRDLVIGSGLEFENRGAHELKGVPGDWQLFAVASAEMPAPSRTVAVCCVRRYFGHPGFVEAALVGDVGWRVVGRGTACGAASSAPVGGGGARCVAELSRVMTAAVGRHRRGNNSRLPGWVV